MKPAYLVDIFNKKLYGPYTNLKKMKKDIKDCSSNWFLELGMNIYVLQSDDLKTMEEFSNLLKRRTL